MKVVKSYSLNEGTIERVRSLSEALGVSDSAVVELLIRIGYSSINDNVLSQIMHENAEG